MTEQVTLASDAAAAVDTPMIVDAGAGFGEPLHTMRTVREFVRAGIAGVHIEDQIFPKPAHYHTSGSRDNNRRIQRQDSLRM